MASGTARVYVRVSKTKTPTTATARVSLVRTDDAALLARRCTSRYRMQPHLANLQTPRPARNQPVVRSLRDCGAIKKKKPRKRSLSNECQMHHTNKNNIEFEVVAN